MALGLGLAFGSKCDPCGGSGMRGYYDTAQTSTSGFQFTNVLAGVTKHTDDEIKLVIEIKLKPPEKWDDGTTYDPVFTKFEDESGVLDTDTLHIKKEDGSAFGNQEGLREYTFIVPKADHDGSYTDTWRIAWTAGGDRPEAAAFFFVRNMVLTVTSDGGTNGDKFYKKWNFKKCKNNGTHNSTSASDMVDVTVAKDGIEPYSVQGTLELTKGWMLDDYTDGYN